MRPSCHTLSMAFEISKKSGLTSRGGLQSNDAYISWFSQSKLCSWDTSTSTECNLEF